LKYNSSRPQLDKENKRGTGWERGETQICSFSGGLFQLMDEGRKKEQTFKKKSA